MGRAADDVDALPRKIAGPQFLRPTALDDAATNKSEQPLTDTFNLFSREGATSRGASSIIPTSLAERRGGERGEGEGEERALFLWSPFTRSLINHPHFSERGEEAPPFQTFSQQPLFVNLSLSIIVI